jgi:hypothetical protein
MPARRSPSDEPMVRETECYADPNLWDRAGSTPFSCVSAEAQSIGSPLPLPDAFSDRRVNDFDDRLTPSFLCGRLAFRLNSKPNAAAFDNDRLAAFRSVEQ